MKDEDINLEEIEASHTLGGYRRCRCYSASQGQRVGSEKNPRTCVHARARSMRMGWVLVRILLCCQIHYSQ
jgi:hypothetical protein